MRQLGYPASLIAEMVEGPSASQVFEQKTKPLKFSTRFYIEVDTAKELGMSIAEYQKLSRWERKVWFYFRYLSGKKDEFAREDAEEERKNNQNRETSVSSNVRQRYRE